MSFWVKIMNKIAFGFGILMLLFAVLVSFYTVNTYFGVTLAANLAYQREFGDDVVMAYDQADFQGILNQLTKIWNKMNITFAGADYAHTYSDINFMPWDNNLVYSNTLQAQNDYFARLTSSLEYNIKCKYDPTFRPMFWDEFKALNDTRHEMKREGGLDWALKGCWKIHYNPSYPWIGRWLGLWIILAAILWILTVAGLLISVSE